MSAPERILLVDDEVAVRNAYQLYLEAKGYGVISASSVAEALRVLRSEEISVVILDIYLQEESGLELLKGIVAAQLLVPVIIMSGVPRSDDVFREALDSGAAGAFSKTVPLEGLLREVRRVLSAEHRQ